MNIDRPFRAELDIARQLAVLASEIALHYFHRGVSADTKPDGTPVTVADRDIEQKLLQALTRFRPEDAVLGEELGARGSSPRRWLLDPIDGTSNFVCGDSQWGTHVALEVEQHIVLGVITRPAQGLSWWACRGCGAYRSEICPGSTDVRLHVSTRAELSESRVTVWTNKVEPVLDSLRRQAQWVEPKLDAILHLAEGRLEAVIDGNGKPWDHAPAVVLVEEAGGMFSDSLGGHSVYLGEGRFTNGLIHRELDAFLAT
jgi:fructose-1,6-bisphosphatase/inositol monophosphatase family enzyme